MANKAPITSRQRVQLGLLAVSCSAEGRRTNAVELRREDLQYDESEAELGQAGADVGALERPLRGADLDEFFWREDDGLGAVET